MKNFQKHVMVFFLVLGMAGGVFAQAPYKHSIGVTAGNFEALSYKTFFTNHLALQLDLGYKYTVGATRYGNIDVNSFELNPNLMYKVTSPKVSTDSSAEVSAWDIPGTGAFLTAGFIMPGIVTITASSERTASSVWNTSSTSR